MPVAVQISATDDTPAGHRAEVVGSQETVPLRAAHVPDHEIAGSVVHPNQVRMPIAVEISATDDTPTGHRAEIVGSLEQITLRSCLIPGHDIVGGGVHPQQIGMSVAV